MTLHPSPDMHQRPLLTLRSSSSSVVSSRTSTPRLSPLLPSISPNYQDKFPHANLDSNPSQATVCGLPLKYLSYVPCSLIRSTQYEPYLSLVTLAVQNATLSIVMHYSRVSIPPALAYSPASAVLLSELLKGSISFIIALVHSPVLSPDHPQHHLHIYHYNYPSSSSTRHRKPSFFEICYLWSVAFCDLCADIFSPDCWKLSIPAILYVVQNSLQFVAISNLPVASFQVTYQMKILTTAAFSVALLRKKLTPTKWLSLFFLAIGVGIVQIQTTAGHVAPRPSATAVGSAHEFHVHVMSPLKGFGAVTAACFTSGLAGVYFEMVLKGSKADLWVRNVQLSLFSLIPALLPILYAAPPPDSRGFLLDLFRHFGGWAWATVAIQVLGGLVTAIVIKYSDNILKGFATSLSIVLSFLASVALFDFSITPSFIIGASTVLTATWMYNQPAAETSTTAASSPMPSSSITKEPSLSITVNGAEDVSEPSSISGKSTPLYPVTPVGPDVPVLGQFVRRKSGGFGGSRNSSTTSLTGLIGSLTNASGNGGNNISRTALGGLGLAESGELHGGFGQHLGSEMLDTPRYHDAPYGSPFSSKAPSRVASRPSSPAPSSPTSVSNQNRPATLLRSLSGDT
jgi:solute carrier family 35 (UDP-sugar transporter), member A1/2/3